MQSKLLWTIIVNFDTCHLQITRFAFVKYLRKIGSTMKQCISCL